MSHIEDGPVSLAHAQVACGVWLPFRSCLHEMSLSANGTLVGPRSRVPLAAQELASALP